MTDHMMCPDHMTHDRQDENHVCTDDVDHAEDGDGDGKDGRHDDDDDDVVDVGVDVDVVDDDDDDSHTVR